MLNRKYQSQSDAIASYNYTDIAEGTGIVKYYGYSAYDGSENYKLGTGAQYSNTVELEGGLDASDTFTKDLDIDFDLSAYNFPQTLRGQALVNITLVLDSFDVAHAGTQAYVLARIKKGDVEIASGQGETLSLDTKPKKKINCIPITIPKTTFKEGEILRVTIEVWAKANTTEDVDVYIGFDPQNRDGTLIVPSTDDPATTTK